MTDNSKKGSRMRPLGRGALLLGASSNFTKPGIGLGQYYKPVSVNDSLPNAPPAIPGECAVQDSWQYLSNAPVAYQMQQVMRAKEDSCEEQGEEQQPLLEATSQEMRAKEDSCEEQGEEQQPLLGATSQEDTHLPRIKLLCNHITDFAQQTKQKLQGKNTGNVIPEKAKEKEQVSGTDTKVDSMNLPWEPYILDKDHFHIPDLASNADFPELKYSKTAVKKI